MNAIEVTNLTKIYKLYDKPMDRLKESISLKRRCLHREFFALDDISFTVAQGECLGILGKNGAGKSTLLKIVTGVLSATRGKVCANGRISALLELGAGFNQEYTGIENIYLNGTILGYSKEEMDERMQGILDFADIGEYVYQPVKTYSSGMFVRLAFAVAINVEPDILIVDEALAVGDIMFQVKCYRKIQELRDQGKTVLFVTHALDSVMKYCDRVMVMSKGKIIGEGKPAAMVDLYKQVLVGLNPIASGEKGEDEDDPNKKVPLDYGTRQATITGFGLYDALGSEVNSVMAGQPFTIRMQVLFHADVVDPVFAFTIKDLKGFEITGTNTMFEGLPSGRMKAGDQMEVTFTQQMELAGGPYVISLGCVGFEKNDFSVYHRLYDCIPMEFINPGQCAGVVRPLCQIEMHRP